MRSATHLLMCVFILWRGFWNSESEAWESPLKCFTGSVSTQTSTHNVEKMERLHTRHQAASCCTGHEPFTPVLVIHAEMSYNSTIIVTPRNKPTVLQNSNKEQRVMLAACGCWCFRIINSLTPCNLPGVGDEALPHVTDISDLIWLVITPSYSFRAFHTSVLQF